MRQHVGASLTEVPLSFFAYLGAMTFLRVEQSWERAIISATIFALVVFGLNSMRRRGRASR